MTISHKEKLATLIASSNLSFSQKELWSLFMKISKTNEDKVVFEAAKSDEENLFFMTKHLQNKIWEYNIKKESWKDILNKQEELAKLLK